MGCRFAVKKCAYEQVSAITEKIKDMLDPTSGMTDAQKSSYDRKVMNKVYSGKKLSAEEMRYIKIHYPALYPYVERVQIQRQALEERIKHCHSKEEVQDVYSEAMFHISDDDPAKQMLYAAYDDVLKEFKKTSDYQELPETKEDAEKKKQTKKFRLPNRQTKQMIYRKIGKCFPVGKYRCIRRYYTYR